MGLGKNTLAALITRGCGEMMKLAVKLGAKPQTLSGLSGMGDLMLTCYSSLSRNRTVGHRLGKGEKLEEIIESMNEIAEGVETSLAAEKLLEKYGIDSEQCPIILSVARILKGDISPNETVDMLMNLPVDREHEPFVWENFD